MGVESSKNVQNNTRQKKLHHQQLLTNKTFNNHVGVDSSFLKGFLKFLTTYDFNTHYRNKRVKNDTKFHITCHH